MQQIPGTVTPSRSTLDKTRIIALMVVAGPIAMSAVGLAIVWQNRLIGSLELGLLAILYAISGQGITMGFHRLFSHRSSVASRPLEAALAVAGSLAAQGPLIRWVADHRRHHRPGRPPQPTVRKRLHPARSVEKSLVGTYRMDVQRGKNPGACLRS